MRGLMLILIFAACFMSKSCYSQKGDIMITVLKKNKANKAFLFDSSSKEDGLYKIYVTYLGTVTANNKGVKIITRKTVWGSNQHTSGAIYIYDEKNKYVGKYVLGSGFDLPNKVQKSQLIFSNKNKPGCDPKLITEIDFSKEIPKKIFLKCKGEHGDVYSFSTEKD